MDQISSTVIEYGLYLIVPIVFLAVVAWIFRPGAKKRYQADGDIPFEGVEKDGRTPPDGR